MLNHFILIKYSVDTPEPHIEAFCQQMLSLKSQIESIRYLEMGRDILHEGRSWDVIAIMKFDGVAQLRAYQQHESHLALAEFNAPYVVDIAAIDYETAYSTDDAQD